MIPCTRKTCAPSEKSLACLPGKIVINKGDESVQKVQRCRGAFLQQNGYGLVILNEEEAI
jgi:hypothetical protein